MWVGGQVIRRMTALMNRKIYEWNDRWLFLMKLWSN